MDRGLQWQDHPQTSALYDAEGDWMDASKSAGERLPHTEAQKFLRKVSGSNASIIPVEGLSVRDRTGRPLQPLGYTIHQGNLLVNPEMVGDTHRLGFLTHEGSHLLGEEGHGPNLASRHLQVVRKSLGSGEAEALQSRYQQFKVGFTHAK